MKELTMEQKLSLIQYRYEILFRNCTNKRKKTLMRNKRRQIMDEGNSLHHIFPKVHYRDRLENTVYIDQEKHNKYHHLFDAKDPYEILDYLTNYFWNGKIELIKEYINQYETKH